MTQFHICVFLTFFALSQSQDNVKTCGYTIWDEHAITAAGSFGSDFGLLSTLYNIRDIDTCARFCLYFRYCYIAEYQRRAGIGLCDLYYYNFPPLFRHEIDSPVRIITETRWAESAIVFNLSSCEQHVSYKHPCAFQTSELLLPDIGRGRITERPSTIRALNVEHCALRCGNASELCQTAVFQHRQINAEDADIYSFCHLFRDPETAVEFQREAVRRGHAPTLISSVSCRAVDDFDCVFTEGDEVFSGSSDFAFPADVHYGADNLRECASICGYTPFCRRAEYDKSGARPRCLLYKQEHIDTGKLRPRRPSEKDKTTERRHVFDIACLNAPKNEHEFFEVAPGESVAVKVENPEAETQPSVLDTTEPFAETEAITIPSTTTRRTTSRKPVIPVATKDNAPGVTLDQIGKGKRKKGRNLKKKKNQ